MGMNPDLLPSQKQPLQCKTLCKQYYIKLTQSAFQKALNELEEKWKSRAKEFSDEVAFAIMFEGPIGLPYKKLMGDAKWAQMMEPPKFDAIPPRYKGTAAWPWKYDYMHQAMVVKTFLKQGIDEFVKANKGRMESHGNIASFCKLLKNPRATTKQIDAKMEEVAKLLRHNQMYPELPKELAERLMSGETHGL